MLAALAIASLCLVMALQVMTQSARVSSRLSHETAARDLMRRLLAEDAMGNGQSGVFVWTASVSAAAPHLARRALSVGWQGGEIAATRLEVAP